MTNALDNLATTPQQSGYDKRVPEAAEMLRRVTR